MTDYVLGNASSEQAANLTSIQNQARQTQTQVFNANAQNKKMLMFAFDGTGNDKDNPAFGNPSNVAHIYNSAKTGLSEGGSGDAFYFKGPGTGNLINQIVDGGTGASVINTSNEAYKKLVDYANQNPNADLTIGTTGFSRGAATARVFMNKVWEEGIPDLNSKISLGFDSEGKERFGYTAYLVEPHKADLGIAMLYDTVATGAARQDDYMKIPPAPGLKVYQLVAEDERRGVFAVDSVVDSNNPSDSRINQWTVAGAHSDVGGTYSANGIGLKTLDIGYNLIKNSGVPMADLSAEQQYAGQPLIVHDSFKGFYGPNAGPGDAGYVSESRLDNAKTYTNPSAIGSRTIQKFDDGSSIETLTYVDGAKQLVERKYAWQVFRDTVTVYNENGSIAEKRITTPDEQGIGKTTQVLNGQNQLIRTTQKQTFDDGSSLEFTTTPDGKVVAKSFDTDGLLAGTITDTPDGLGGMDREINTVVNGKAVIINQYATQEALDNDLDGDGLGGNDARDYKTRSIKIGGQQAVNDDAVAGAWDEMFSTGLEIIESRSSVTAKNIVMAGDANIEDGFIPFDPSSTTGGGGSGSGGISWFDADNLSNTTDILTSTQGLIAAIRTGNNRAIAVNAFSLTASLLKDKTPEWLQATNSVYGTLNTISNLHDAFAKGNVAGIVSGSSTLGMQVVNKQLNTLTEQLIKDGLKPEEIAQNLQVVEFKALIKDLNVAVAVVNFYSSWQNKQYADAIMASLSVSFPQVYAAYQLAKVAHAVVDKLLGPALANILIGPLPAIMSLVNDIVGGIVGMFEEPKHPHAAAHFVSNQDGQGVHALFTDEGDYGGEKLQPVLDAISQSLDKLHQDSQHNSIAGLGWLTSRMPAISYQQGVFTLHITDSYTGQSYTRTFDLQGQMTGGSDVAGEAASHEAFFDNIVQQFINEAVKNGASAQSWEVQTADGQHQQGHMVDDYTTQYDENGTPYSVLTGSHFQESNALAGQTTEARARAQGQLITSAGASQTFNPIVLDLDGNGIAITSKQSGNGVMIDGDDDGFAEESDWIGTRDGILVLDRNGDGQISGGHEMFSDASVNMAARGLHALDEIDQNGDGKINSLDAVYSHLQVWTDINHDGVAQSYELSNLSSKGITELNIATGQFSMNTSTGSVRTGAMAATSLNADSTGFVTQSVGNSVLVVSEADQNNPKLMATAAYDYGTSSNATIRAQHTHKNGNLTTKDELIDSMEDTAITVSAAQLLANDIGKSGIAGGSVGANLTISSVGNGQHGTVTFDSSNATITFKGDANYNGKASFDYTVTDAMTGLTSTATTTVDVGAVNDALPARPYRIRLAGHDACEAANDMAWRAVA